jgi:MFS family permease
MTSEAARTVSEPDPHAGIGRVETSIAGGAPAEGARDALLAAEALVTPAPAAARGLWQNRDFRLVLGGQSISAFGDAITFTALPLLVVTLTGSGLAMGTVGVLQTLPDLFFGLPAGALADRWDRRRLIIWADLGRALLTALIPLSFALGWPTMLVILAVTFPINTLRVLFLAAWTAATPAIVGRDQVGRANGYTEAAFSISFIVGPAIAGFLVASIGPGPTLAIDAASFLVSAGAMVRVKRRLRATRTGSPTRLMADITEGLRFLAGERTLRVAVSYWSLVSVASASLVPAVIFYLTQEHHAGSDVVGLILSGYGVGYLVGALVAGRLSSGPLGRLMIAFNLASAAVLAVFVLVPEPIVQAAMTFAAGGCSAVVLISYLTLRATIPPDELLGRVGSTARTISLGLSPIGLFAGGIALDAFGGRDTLLGIAALVAIVSLVFATSATLRAARARGGPAPTSA